MTASDGRLKRAVMSLALAGAMVGSGVDPVFAATTTCRGAYSLAVHGGAWDDRPPDVAALEFLHGLLTELQGPLAAGGTAVDTVQAAVVRMEDSGLFNAGRGAIANALGQVETDAAIMDGSLLDAGAVASMVNVRNPVVAARAVMDQTRHVLLVGDRGAATLATLGIEPVDAGYFLNNRASADNRAGSDNRTSAGNVPGDLDGSGTVGAVARDRCGNLAAATSTGGYDAKLPGRVGDVPVIGAGTYAKNGVVAISATGYGEYFIRYTAAVSVAARIEFGGQYAQQAASEVLADMQSAGGLGGLLIVTASGRVEALHSTRGMAHGYVRVNGRVVVPGYPRDRDEDG